MQKFVSGLVQAMTIVELRAELEFHLRKMRTWKDRDYELERAMLDVLDTSASDIDVMMRVKTLLDESLAAMLRNAEPEGNA